MQSRPGVPIPSDIGVHKVHKLPLAPWKRLGRGIAIQLPGTAQLRGMYVVIAGRNIKAAKVLDACLESAVF